MVNITKIGLLLTFIILLIWTTSITATALTPLPGFTYSKAHVIEGSPDGQLTYYQVHFNIYNTVGTGNGETVYLNGHAKADFSDIRFADVNGNQYPYYIESSNASYASVLANITSIPTSGTTVYLWYGNSGANSQSNPYAVFPIFDDFNGVTANSSQWIMSQGAPTQSDGIISFSANQIVSKIQIGTGYALTARASIPVNPASGTFLDLFDWNGGSPYQHSIRTLSGGNNYALFSQVNGNSGTSTNLGPGFTGWHIWKISRDGGPTVKFYCDNTLLATHTNQNTASRSLAVHAQSWGIDPADQRLLIDYLYVSKFTQNSPQHGAWGVEQIGTSTQPVASFTINPNSGTVPLTTTISSTSTGNPNNLYWDLGDGSTSTSASFTHIYQNPGTYTVTLTASNYTGYWGYYSTATHTVTVLAATPGPTPIIVSNYTRNIIGGNINTSRTIQTFNDDSFTGLLKGIIPNSTDEYDVGKTIYYGTKPLSYNGIGNWWIVITIIVVGALMIMSQSGSPFLLILAALLGNFVLWAFLPFDWVGTITALAILDISILVLTLIRPGKDR